MWGKISKERLTVLLCVNMEGEFEEPFIIGKAAKPRCFKGIAINSLNVEWRSNKRAWMTRDLMSDWLLAFDRKMKRQKRKVILFLDNATSHPKLELENVKLMFLPPNVTAACQPLDQGVIQNFKVNYRQFVVRHILSKIDDAHSTSQLASCVNVLDAVLWTRSAIKKIKPLTVYNCFVKAGYPADRNLPNVDEHLTTETQLDELIEQLGGEKVDATDFVAIDENVHTEDTRTDINELVASVLDDNENGDEDEQEEVMSTEESCITPASYQETLEFIQKIKAMFMHEADSEGLKLIHDIEQHVEQLIVNKKNIHAYIHTHNQ